MEVGHKGFRNPCSTAPGELRMNAGNTEVDEEIYDDLEEKCTA